MNRKQRRTEAALSRRTRLAYFPEDFTITLPKALSEEGEAELRAYVASLGCKNLTIVIEEPAE